MKRNLPNGRVLTIDETESLLAEHFDRHGDQDLIGLSGLITTLQWQADVANLTRRLQPQTLLISGGGLATEFRDILFHWIPELDGIAHSEGDDVILKMAYDAKMIRNLGVEKATRSGKLGPYFIEIVNGRPRFYYDGGRQKDLKKRSASSRMIEAI